MVVVVVVDQGHEPLCDRVCIPPGRTFVGVGISTPHVDDDPAAVVVTSSGPSHQIQAGDTRILLNSTVRLEEIILLRRKARAGTS